MIRYLSKKPPLVSLKLTLNARCLRTKPCGLGPQWLKNELAVEGKKEVPDPHSPQLGAVRLGRRDEFLTIRPARVAWMLREKVPDVLIHSNVPWLYSV